MAAARIAARPAGGAPPGRRLVRVLAVLGAVLVVALQVAAVEWQSVTSDEAYHLYAGFSALRYGTNTVNFEHPPLVKLLAGAPLAAEAEPYAPPARMADALVTAERLFDEPARLHGRVLRSRLVLLFMVALPLIAACFALGRRWADSPTGVLLALAVGLSMAALPYLSLALTDAAVALGFVLTLLAAERFLRRPGPASAVLLGLAWGLALSAKYSAVLLAPTVAAALALAPGIRERRGVAARLAAAALTVVAAGAPVLAAGRAANPDYDPASARRSLVGYARGETGLHVEDRLLSWEPRLLAIERISPGAAQWLAGMLSVAAQTSVAAYPSYAFGSVSSYGRWWYFPAVFAVETPLVVLAAGIGAAAWSLAHRRPRSPREEPENGLRRRRNAVAVVTVGVYLAAAFGSSYNVGVRHLLPVLPLLYLPAAWLAARRRAWAVAFALLLAAEAIALTPRWMSATNTWWLGEHDPARFALSAGEYHQNFRLLARDLDRLGVERVTVAFPALGERRLQAYLPGGEVADRSRLPGPGWHAVTVSLEQLAPAILRSPPERIYRFDRFGRAAREWERYLRALRLWGEDRGYAGETFHLYRIPEAPESRPREPG